MVSWHNCSINFLDHIFFGFSSDIPVTIGLEQGFYSTGEDSGELEICVEVESGDIAGRTITINYNTLDGSATGMIS